MKKWTLLDTVTTPDGKTLTLSEHDGAYFIRVDGVELMSTRRHASEDLLARVACAGLAGKAGARVLIGGLGMGFTLRETLAQVGADAEVVVAELLPAVIAWNRNPAYPLAAKELADPRVKLVERDVAKVIGAAGPFDAIMLDVDNGPDALTAEQNAGLYAENGLRAAKRALKPGGVVAYWSAESDPRFEQLMKKVGYATEVHRSRAHVTSGAWHTVFVGR